MPKFALEKKFNGFRAIIVKKDDSVKIYSDQSRDITSPFPTVTKEVTQLNNKDIALDCEIVLYENKIPKGRAEIAKYIGAVESKKEIDDSGIIFHAFDCLYFDKDITSLPWNERKNIFHSFRFTPHIKEVPSIIVDSRGEAEKAIKLLKNLKGSEGAMIKRYEGVYSPGKETDAWIKFRNEDQLVVKVIKKNTKENGYTYTIGIKPEGNINPNYVQNGILILGDTFVTKISAESGDNLAINVEEVWRHTYPKKNNSIRYSIHKPKVMEKTNNPISSVNSLDNLAVSKGEEVIENEDLEGETTTGSPGIASIQGKVWGKKKLPILPSKYYEPYKDKKKLNELDSNKLLEAIDNIKLEPSANAIILYKDFIEELGTRKLEEPRETIAKKFWESSWQNMYPKNGKGKFIYHHHWRGLTDEEANKLSNEQLLNTNHSIHGDLRFEINPQELFGFTVFTGTASDNKAKGGDKLIYESQHKDSPTKLEGSFKLAIPYDWINVGIKKPVISTPKGVGATSNKYAKFFAIDNGTYGIGVWRAHMIELFLNGSKFKGRAIMQYAPIGGSRKWLIDFPVDQTPYAESHNKEEIIKELKGKGQKYLIWAKPGEKPEKIEV